MGFRLGAHAMVFEVNTNYLDRNVVKLRLAISKFNRQTNSYEQVWGGYASVLGATAAQKAASLKVKDVITLKDIDEECVFKNGKEYVNRNIYDFDIGRKTYDRNAIVWTDMPERGQYGGQAAPAPAPAPAPKAAEPVVESEDALSDNLPF